jgi:hypothetical protein
VSGLAASDDILLSHLLGSTAEHALAAAAYSAAAARYAVCTPPGT